TPDPADYLITINMNDLATAGALPYGITVTILLPPSSTRKSLLDLQTKISSACTKHRISILGGHTEITQGVSNLILSASMIGFVPPEYYIPRNPQVGDFIICSGWVGAEGTGILIAEGYDLLKDHFDPIEFQHGVTIGKEIGISDQVVRCNQKWHEALHLVHDATEGGIFGAIYECLASKEFGCNIDLESIPVAPITMKLANFLDISPYKLISSGAVLYIVDPKQAKSIVKYLKKNNYPVEIIGEVMEKDKSIRTNKFHIEPPEADHLIIGLEKITKMKS
ncbi:MAG: AIR synthase-related protein, partial [Candidatus Hodarchaeales archaeon]